MPPLLACDLDRTLIYSPKAFWLDVPDEQAPPIVVVELYQGIPISFMTRTAETLLLALKAAATVVPVTTRTAAQYRRVRLPGPEQEYAVTTNGGVLLHHGQPDAHWHASIARRTAAHCAPLQTVEAILADPAFSSWILKLRHAEDLFIYAIVDREAMPEDFVAGLEQQCLALGWTVSLQGRKLYCVPQPVTKSSAVAEVQRRTGAGTVIAAGDSLLDRQMLAEANIAFRPAHGELDDGGYRSSNLTVTTARGIMAGEELLLRMGRVVEQFQLARQG
ncbi:HAD family hydrolase [Paeniglutamicibacter antarcticus]|uniref:HAD family hydrolase n=1 Tax=Arthrobacter terrae TaxID=2935737 RepID=A0A931CMU9_9MICC|nr:HAD family hydrolase [Arthrobacter terrae]